MSHFLKTKYLWDSFGRITMVQNYHKPIRKQNILIVFYRNCLNPSNSKGLKRIKGANSLPFRKAYFKTYFPPLLNFHRNVGEVPFVRNCATDDAQEKFSGNSGTIHRNFRSDEFSLQRLLKPITEI